MPDPAPAAQRVGLAEIAVVFLKLGTTSFGGPAVHIAMLEEEVVRRRRWLDRQRFLDYLGAVNLIPGPNSTELAIHVGHACAGWPGLLVAGACFILPAALIVSALAAAYVRFGALPAAAGLLYGIKPVVIAVVLQALFGLGRTALRRPAHVALALLATAAALAGVHELLVLGAAAALAAGAALRPWWRDRATLAVVPPVALAGGAAALPVAFSLGGLFVVFLKIGAVLFGSGYVLLAFLRADLVERLGWLSERQLLDAIAVGQVTPGPVFTAATFVGYLLAGPAGATVATAGIFLPAFGFVAASGPLLPRLRRSALASAALDGVNVASLALIVAVTWQLGRAVLVDPVSWMIGIAAGALLLSRRVSSAWLVLGGAVVGWLLGT